MKKSLFVLIAVALFFAIASGGCGGNGSPVDTSNPADTGDNVDTSSTNVIIEESGDYTVSYMALYGCDTDLDWYPVWESEGNLENGISTFNVSADYVMYGFEFDTDDDTSNWAFSDVVWTDDDLSSDDVAASASSRRSPRRLRLRLGGTQNAPSLNIAADGKTTNLNCSNDKKRHDWNSKEETPSGTISVHIDTASAYKAQEMNLYGRTKGGKWERLASFLYGSDQKDKFGNFIDTEGNKDFKVSKKYVEFGFEFDIKSGTDWPYSGVFWTAANTEKERPEKIDIDLSGAARNANIKISVNDKEVFSEKDCSGHNVHYGWDDISVGFTRGGAYAYKSASFYGRKSSTSPWIKLADIKSGGGYTLNSDVKQRVKREFVLNKGGEQTSPIDELLLPRDYVEFGFEFDIANGTNWPYSDVFWTAEKSASEAPDTISISTGGAIRTASIEIKVNNKTVVDETNCSSHVPHYFKPDNRIRVKTWKTGAYSNKSTNFYARKAVRGAWTLIKNWTNGDQEFYISENEGYVEFGFEFDITAGTDWPYSGVFWTASQQANKKLEDVYIEMGGTVRNASIGIWVNGNKVVDDSNCDSHYQYYWKTSDNIRVSINQGGAYLKKSCNFYARKAGGRWERKYSKDDPDTFYIDSDYVEFGFEFDITWGTDWPYSGVFWTEEKSRNQEVGSINIDIGGAVRTATISIYVNGNQVFHDGNCARHEQYNWN